MKTLKNIFGSKNTNKSINNFSDQLNFGMMLMIKGGESDNGDTWPPKTGTGDDSDSSN